MRSRVTVDAEPRKTCSRCKSEKLISEFGLHKRSSGGLRSYCKVCWNAYKHEWRIKNPDKFSAHQAKARRVRKERGLYKPHPQSIQRVQRLKRLYNLTTEQYDAMVKEQDGRCACCGKVPELEFRVDHDHVTGEVRGLLCMPCNSGIGLLGDTAERVELAVDYLNGKRHVCI